MVKVVLIKICIITPYYHPIIGGITTFVYNLQKNLKDRGNSVSVITKEGHGNSDAKVLRYNKYLFILKAYNLIRREKPTILHSHSHWYILAPCVLYKTFHPKTIVIHTYHTEYKTKIRGIKKMILGLFLSKCDTVTFVSKDLENKIEGYHKISTNKKVIYAGITTKKVDQKEVDTFRDRYNINETDPVISFIGPLVWKEKVEGVKRLIEAFILIEKQYSNARLLIVGDGKYKKELEILCSRGNLKEKVIFCGFIENAFVPLSLTNIYAHISLQEGLPIALLEAMSCGKTVVASNIGGIPELITNKKNGILVEPVPENIAQEIIDLLSNADEMNRLGEAAKKHVEDKFSWDRAVDEYLELYDQDVS